MRVVGLITEYNPFHNGHSYHIQRAKKVTGADYCVAVMSGNYVQRGEPACMDKYLRTHIALRSGADLVLELPVPFAIGSAEYFAAGAVSILDKLGIVDSLCFGSESGDLALLSSVASILSDEPKEFSQLIKDLLKKGLSYPAARNQALLSYLSLSALPAGPEDRLTDQVNALLSAPNNILGIEYLKALYRRHSSIKPATILRTSDYLSKALSAPFCSSSAIRHVFHSRSAGLASGPMSQTLKTVRSYMPEEAYSLIAENFNKRLPIFVDDFSSVLLYKLLSARNADLTDYSDLSPELENRIKNCLTDVSTFSDFIDSVKCRQYTRTRISRALLHILLDIRVEDIARYKNNDFVPYARVLGFKKSSGPLLKGIKKNGSIPLLTKMADAENRLSPMGFDMLNQEVFASNLYQSVVYHKFGYRMKNEYTQGVIVEP
ncbi:nucleotidyltransferase [Qiania dongpingensis]|uniref:tRNA(Met) cytidine acetate ligase n=1 Tax=Qiania dongpingensis TaxID=2763669 RepID=A0A7G9G528_9FIRM|nr:nucleotidyltransferase [Qiania dongpingensis]QNM05910.1 nucleotidyltransferase [Qiania dongpingensis]